MLPKEAIEEFKVLYKKRFGKDISDQEASDRANRLVTLYSLVYSPVFSKETKQRQNKAFDIPFNEVEKTRKNSE